MSDDSKPYRSGPPIKTGDRVAFVFGDQRIEGTAQVESGPLTREQNIRIIPDGEPMIYGRDYTLGVFALPEIFADEDLKITAHRWLPREPIPYDEMRRLCGLPSKEYLDTLADLERYGLKYVLMKKITSSQPWWIPVDEPSIKSTETRSRTAHQALAAMEADYRMLRARLPKPSDPKPKQTPPMWADIPGRNHRPAKTRNHRRVK